MRNIAILAALLALYACLVSKDITAPTDDPKEIFILYETQRVAEFFGKKITAEVTDEVYMVTGSTGEKVPAAGWYIGGHIKYWRKVVREYDYPILTELAIHEVCHSQVIGHDDRFWACMNLARGAP